MWKALTKTRSANFYANQVKFLIVPTCIFILFCNAPGVRNFTAESMRAVASIVDTY